MSRKIIFVMMPVFMLACSFLLPARESTLQETPTGKQPIETNNPQKQNGFTVVRLHPAGGDLQELLSVEAQKAVVLGQIPIVEFDATWCPPCQKINDTLKAKNDLMLKAYNGTYIIKLDVDEWKWEGNKVQNFYVEFIPVYFKLDERGNQTGEFIDGGAWGEDIPENIAPVMDKFFHNKN